MILQSLYTLRDTFATRRRQAELAATFEKTGDTDGWRSGFNPAPFAIHRGPEAENAMRTMLAELLLIKEICDRHGIALRLVTVPPFPKIFYDTQRGRDWTRKIGDYDYSIPEKEIDAFAREHAIPILTLGEVIESKKLEVEEIRSLFFVKGTGHFTEKGHRFIASAMAAKFYSQP